MRLYYFTPEHWGLVAIRDRRLKISRVDQLNDPHEWIGVKGNREERAKLNKWKKDTGARIGILCFSANWQHPLMWGHYADKHAGLCLGFDVIIDDTVVKVDYQPEPPEFKLAVKATGDSMAYLLIKTKFEDWKYESEYRALCALSPDMKDHVTGHWFHSFSDDIQLKEVIVGAHSQVTRKQLKDVLGPDRQNVTSFKARPAFQTYSVTKNLRKRDWK